MKCLFLQLSTAAAASRHARRSLRALHAFPTMADELDELVEFLGSTRADMRAQAAEIVQGLTGTDEGISSLVAKKHTLIPKLLHLMGAPAAESKPAATALVNLTGAPDVATLAVEKGAVERCMQFLRNCVGGEAGETGCPADLLLSILVNVTNTEGGVHVFAQEGLSLEGFFVAKLTQMLVEGVPSKNFDRAASVLTNVCRHPCGRRNFLEPSRKLVRHALPSLNPSASETRRMGIASAFRNCCADTQSCELLLLAAGEGNAAAVAVEASTVGFEKVGKSGAGEGGLACVRALLKPVSGSKSGMQIERCDAVRQSCAEAVAGLANCEKGRAALVQCDAPALIKAGYEKEEHPETLEAMEIAGEKFMRHGLVPREMQPNDGLRRVEVVDEGKNEVEEIQGGARPLMTPDVD